MARTDAQNRATYKYAKEHLKRIPLDVKLEEYAQIKAAADQAGESVNGFIKQAIRSRLAADPVQADRWGDMAGAAGAEVTPPNTSKE